jgi:TonB family protein
MFALIESARSSALDEGWAGRVGSFALHSALIATAVLATGETRPRAPDSRVVTSLVWDMPPRTVVAAPSAPGAPAIGRPAIDLPVLPLTVSTELPPPGPPPALPGVPITVAVPPVVEPAAPAPGTILEPRYVEELPLLLRHPPLRFPELLRQPGLEGTILVEAVLDTAGVVEPASLRVRQGGHALFEAEALRVVRESRYRPARVNGRAVRVRLQVPVTFMLRR